MPSRDHHKNRRSYVSGPVILPFDRLEKRQLLTAADVSSIQQAVVAAVGVDSTDPSSTTTTVTTSAGDTSASTTSVGSTSSASTTGNSGSSTAATTTTTVDPSTTLVTTTAVPVVAPAPAPASSPGTPTPAGGLVAASLSAPSSLAWGQTFVLKGSIRNNGSMASTTPAEANIYLSPTATSGSKSLSLATFTVPAGLPPGALYNFSYPLTIPKSPSVSVLSGNSYYITTTVGFASDVNTGTGVQGVDASKVTVAQALPATLIASGFSVSSGTNDWGQNLNITAKVTNSGPGNAPATNARIIMVPYGEDPFGFTGYTIGTIAIPQITAGQTVSTTQAIQLPSTPPAVLANASKFTLVMVNDAAGQANPVSTRSTYQGLGLDWTTVSLAPRSASVPASQLPQLTATTLTTPTVVGWGQDFQVKVHVQNVGAGDAGPFDVRFSLIQNTVAGTPVLLLGDASVSGLKAGQEQDVVQTIKMPSQAPTGMVASGTPGRIIATIDPNHTLNQVRTAGTDTLQSPAITLKLVSQDGTTTPVVTSTTHSTAPAPVSSAGASNTSPPGAGTSSTSGTTTATIPISGQAKAAAGQRLVRKKAQPVVHKTAPHLTVYPRKHQVITVNTPRRQIRIVTTKHN